jgi:hypothetical protein
MGVPGVAGDVRDALDRAVVRCVKAVVHRRRQAQGHVAAVAVVRDQRVVDQQIMQRVGKTLGLDQLDAVHLAEAAHDAVARADQHPGIAVERPRARRQLAHEAVVQAGEVALLGLVQAQVRASLPGPEREIADRRLLDLAEPAEGARHQPARDAVGQQKEQLIAQRRARALRRGGAPHLHFHLGSCAAVSRRGPP